MENQLNIKNYFMKIKLDSYDYLSLKKILCFFVLDIIVKSVFQIKNEYHPIKKINVNMSVNIFKM